MTDIIYNSIKSSALEVVSLSDPSRVLDVTAKKVDFLTASVAKNINDQRMAVPPPAKPKMAVNLEPFIIDIVIETAVQGASFLEVHLFDPAWTLLKRDSEGIAFFDVDADGFLWPPIEVDFPPGGTQKWILCQLRPSTDLTGANMVLMFEDKIVSQCRDMSSDPVVGGNASLATSRHNETRAEFIERCVKTAVPGVNFQALFGAPQDANAFNPADLSAGEVPPTKLNPVAGRKKPANRHKPQITDKHRAVTPPRAVAKSFVWEVEGTAITIAQSIHDVVSPPTTIQAAPTVTLPAGVNPHPGK